MSKVDANIFLNDGVKVKVASCADVGTVSVGAILKILEQRNIFQHQK